MVKCRFCASVVTYKHTHDSEVAIMHCPRCGNYEITGAAQSNLESIKFHGATVSGWIRQQNAVGSVPSFDTHTVHRVTNLQRPELQERIERYLLTIAEKFPELGADFDPFAENLIGASYSSSQHELEILVGYLVKQELLREKLPKIYWLNPKGHIAADELRSKRAKSSQAFVAMWFGEAVRPIYDNAIEPAIIRAGYKSLRIDRKEDVVKIDDEILSEIRRSAFIVADFTEHRGGVYFEAGFAMGLGIPIVWTCRHDHMNELHFDIRQYNCLSWVNEDDFLKNLQKRIEGFLGHGPQQSLAVG